MAGRGVVPIRWEFKLVDNATRAILKSDRQVRTSLNQQQKAFRDTGSVAQRTSDMLVRGSQRVSAGLGKQGATATHTAADVAKLSAAQERAVALSGSLIARSNEVTNAYRRQGAAAIRAAEQQQKAAAAMSRAARGGGRGIGVGAAALAGRGARNTTAVGLAAAGFGAFEIGKQTIQFDRDMRNVNSIAQLSEKRLRKLGASVRDLGGKTAQSPHRLAEGLYDLVSSGFDAKQSLQILKSSATAATAGLSDTATSTAAVAAVLNAYHRPASAAANVSDVLFQTVNRGVISFEQLASNIGDVLPFASSLGISLDQVGAAVSTMTKQGINAPETMTRIKNVMQALIKPSEGMSKALKTLGVRNGETLIKQKGFQGALETLLGTTDKTKESIAKLFPNIRGLGGVLALTGANAKTAHGDLAAFGKGAKGAMSNALAQQSKSIAYQWQRIKTTASGMAIEIGTKLVPAAANALTAIRNLFSAGKGKKSPLQQLLAGLKGQAPKTVVPSPMGPPRPGPWAPVVKTPSFGRPLGAIDVRQAPQVAPPSGAQSLGEKIRGIVNKVLPLLKTIGQAALTAGKQLVDAFKPAMPFFQNVLLPVIEGIGAGLLATLVGAFKIAIPIIKVAATVLGFLGKVLAPLGGLFKAIGVVISFVLGGIIIKALGALAKTSKAFGVFRAAGGLVADAFRLVIGVIGRLWGAFTDGFTIVSRFAGTFTGGVAKVARGTLNIVGAIIHAIETLPGRMIKLAEKIVSSLGSAIGKGARSILSAGWSLGKGLVTGLVNAIKAAPGAIINAITSIIPGPLRSVAKKVPLIGDLFKREGGVISRFAAGGLVPAMVSPGEQVLYGGSSWTVPGPRIAADSVFAALPVGAAVMTFDGQRRMAGGASLASALATQAPHFAAGGTVGQKVTGRVSTFGPPTEPRGTTASGVTSQSRGVAIRPGASFQSGRPFLGGFWRVQIGGHTATLKQIDIGPNQSTGRRIDVTGAGARFMGLNPAKFPTDHRGTATFLGASARGGKASKAGAFGPLVRDALAQGFERGLAGRSGVGGSLIHALALSARRAAATGGATSATLGGGVSGHSELMPGISRIAQAVLSRYRGLAISSTTGGRHVGGSYHYQGRAVDLAGPGSTMNTAAGWVRSSGMYRRLKEGIHNPNLAIKNGRVTSGPGTFGAVWAGHRNHIHLAARRGGLLSPQGFRAGGTISGAVGAITGQGASTARLELLAGLLERATYARLGRLSDSLSEQLHRLRMSKDHSKAAVRRLEAVLGLIDGVVGVRVGRAAAHAQRLVARSTERETSVSLIQRVVGIDPASSAGLAQSISVGDESRGRLSSASSILTKQIRKLSRQGRPIPQALKDQLAEVNAALQENVATHAEQIRAFLQAQASERLSGSQFKVDWNNANMALLEATQSVMGTTDTPGGMLQHAAGIASSIPALQELQRSYLNSAQVAASIGDLDGWRQSLLSATQAATDIATAMATAAEETRRAAEAMAQSAIDASQFRFDIDDAGRGTLEFNQRMQGIYDTPGGRQARADYITQTLIPDLNKIISDDQVKIETERTTRGADSQEYRDAVRQYLADIAKRQGLQIEVLDDISDNTEPLKDYKGTLGFEYRGQQQTDILDAGVGV